MIKSKYAFVLKVKSLIDLQQTIITFYFLHLFAFWHVKRAFRTNIRARASLAGLWLHPVPASRAVAIELDLILSIFLVHLSPYFNFRFLLQE